MDCQPELKQLYCHFEPEKETEHQGDDTEMADPRPAESKEYNG
jgi:hypothetical protein